MGLISFIYKILLATPVTNITSDINLKLYTHILFKVAH